MNAVAGDGGLNFSPIAEINGDFGRGPHALPVQNKMRAQILVDICVRVKRGAKKARVGAA